MKKNDQMARVILFPPVFCLLILILLSSHSQTKAQSTSPENEYQGRSATYRSTAISSVQTATRKTLLDKKIDPESYMLGPGDILSIFIWGNFSGQYQLTITPEGMILIPEIGPVEISGLTLADARQRVTDQIRQKYRSVELTLSLVDLRVFKVFIGGAVVTPGAYPATAVTRVSEVIELAGGFTQAAGEENQAARRPKSLLETESKRASRRNITVFCKNGDTLHADILRLNLLGESEFDPMLKDGDEIFVPVEEDKINLYGVFGAVLNPGYFEYSRRDSLEDLLKLAHGLTTDADSNKIEIVRFNPDHKSTFSLFVNLTSEDRNIPLQQDDRAFVATIQGFNRKSQVELTGEFNYPGVYAIEEDSTMLSEIVSKAGGFTSLASLEDAEMTRVSAEDLVDPEFERLKRMNVADMSEQEYEYFKIKSRTKPGRVAVDFVRLFDKNDMKQDILLRNDDVINVPRKRRVINVSGEVANPGFMTHVPGEDFNYYIRAAGGFSDRAGRSRVSVIKATGEWKKAKKGRSLDPGDTVWIPEKKKHNYVAIIKDVAVFVGNIATVYLVIRQATK